MVHGPIRPVAADDGGACQGRSAGDRGSYNEKLWMLDLLKAVTYPPS